LSLTCHTNQSILVFEILKFLFQLFFFGFIQIRQLWTAFNRPFNNEEKCSAKIIWQQRDRNKRGKKIISSLLILLMPDKKVPSEPLKDIFDFTALSPEIRNMIYLYVLKSHQSQFGTMTLSIPKLREGIKVPYTNIAYACRSKSLQLIRKQITEKVLLLVQYTPQQITFRDLGEGNLSRALVMVEKQPNLQSSVHLLELEYTTPIPEFGPLKGRCYFLPSEVKNTFCSIARLCKNLESIKLSFIVQQKYGKAKELNVEIFCHNKEKNSYLQVSNRWIKMAIWEKTLRMYLKDIERRKCEDQNTAVWRYQCNVHSSPRSN
jgi:hypothetical protein